MTWGAIRTFYVGTLGFREIGGGNPIRLCTPGDSGQEVDIAAAGPGVKSGIQFGVDDLKQTAGILAGLGLAARAKATTLTVANPDGAVISFFKAVARP